MEKRNLTIKDIAKLAGTSHSTVSRVLTNPDYPVRPELKQHVLEIAEKYNYTPNLNGRLLKQRFTPDVGVILPSFANPYHTMIVSSLEARLADADISLIIMSTRRDAKNEKTVIERMLAKRVRAVVLMEGLNSPEAFELLSRKGVKPILLNQQPSNRDEVCLNVDSEYTSALVAERLCELGHKNIGFLSMPVTGRYSRSAYLEGLRTALARHGVKLGADCVAAVQTERDDVSGGLLEFNMGRELAQKLVTRKPKLTALIAANDLMALGALSALHERGISVPDDISVVGRDDIPIAQMSYPALSTVHEPYEEIIGTIVSLLLKNHESCMGSALISLRGRYVERASVGKPRI